MIVLSGATAHLGNGEVMQNAAIGMENGRITFVKPANELGAIAEKADIINVSGKHIYPGFISPNTTLGITEVDAVRASNDFSETGSFNPEARTLTAFNTDSRVATTVRSNGVLITQATPRSGRISGTSSVMLLDGWNWEDAVLMKDDGIHLNWPQRFIKTGWWAAPGPTEPNKKYDEQITELRTFLQRAKAYSENPDAEFNQKLAACKGLFNGRQNLYLHVNSAKSMMEAVLFAAETGIEKPVLVGANEAHLILTFLKERKIPVILKRTHSLPSSADSHVDQPYMLAKQLYDAGVLFCLDYSGDMEAMGSRNLPFVAGTAVAYGLPYEEAVKALTSNTAKILGCDKVCGTLQPNMDATLFVSTGDALDMLTNNVELAYIQGKPIDLDNPQKYLYRKFKAKYE